MLMVFSCIVHCHLWVPEGFFEQRKLLEGIGLEIGGSDDLRCISWGSFSINIHRWIRLAAAEKCIYRFDNYIIIVTLWSWCALFQHTPHEFQLLGSTCSRHSFRAKFEGAELPGCGSIERVARREWMGCWVLLGWSAWYKIVDHSRKFSA